MVDQPLKSITQYSKLLTNIDREDHKNKLEEALRFIKGEIASLEDRMRTSDIDIQKVYEELKNGLIHMIFFLFLLFVSSFISLINFLS